MLIYLWIIINHENDMKNEYKIVMIEEILNHFYFDSTIYGIEPSFRKSGAGFCYCSLLSVC